MKKILLIFTLIFGSLILVSCGSKYEYVEDKINITTTTNVMGDLAKVIGGDKVAVWSIMGAGVDPHGYKEKWSDGKAFKQADFILANGLHLEGKIVDVLNSYNSETKTVLQLGDTILAKSSEELKAKIIEDEFFPDNYDPHFWFDIDLYKEGARLFALSLGDSFPEHAAYFMSNLDAYILELDILQQHIVTELSKIPENQKFLISSHDAFEYFGVMFDFGVDALQGKSTEDEVTPTRMKEVINIVIENNVQAVFPETSVSRDTIRSVQDGVSEHANGYKLRIGNDLFSDSLGDTDNDNTYLKMYRANIKSIVEGITGIIS